MSLARPISPISESDDALRSLLEDAELPALLVALAHVSGDDGALLQGDLLPGAGLLAGPQGGYDEVKLEKEDVCTAS